MDDAPNLKALDGRDGAFSFFTPYSRAEHLKAHLL